MLNYRVGTLCRTRSSDVLCIKVSADVLALSDCKNPQKRKNNHSKWVHKILHAQKRNPLSDLYKIWQGVGIPDNHQCKIWLRSVKGFLGGGGQIFPFPWDFIGSLTTLSCECGMFGKIGRCASENEMFTCLTLWPRIMPT